MRIPVKNAGNKNREPHQDEVRDLGAAARLQGRGDKLDARYKRERKGKRKGRTWNADCVQAQPGRGDRTRTCGLVVPNHARYQLRNTS